MFPERADYAQPFRYLDALPIHPPPEQLETFSSYLMRIIEENDFSYLNAVAEVLHIHSRSVSRLADYPLISMKTVSEYTACPESKLLSTTFFYLARRFERSAQPHALAGFMSSSVEPHQRYCPKCLSEAGYYFLTWRFHILTGCHIHKCRLLDRCEHCKEYIPLFAFRSRVGICPFCQMDLRSSLPLQLPEEEWKIVHQRTMDLEYLLSPFKETEEYPTRKMLGQKFRSLRQQRQQDVQQVIASLGVSKDCIMGLENGNTGARVTLQTYVKYADYLEVDLSTIFLHSFTPPSKPQGIKSRSAIDRVRERQQKRELRERELFEQVQKAVQHFKEINVPITLTAISSYIGISRTALQRYPSISALWEEVAHEQRRLREQSGKELVEQVQQAIRVLIDSNQVLSEKAICNYVQRSQWQLRDNPQVNVLLKQVLSQNSPFDQSSWPDECIIIERVNTAIASIKASQQPLSLQAVSATVGLPLRKLRQYTQVNIILNQVKEEGRQQRKLQAQLHSQKLAEQIQQAIRQLKDANLVVSRETIANAIGLTPRTLYVYPSIRPLINQIVEEYWQQGYLLIAQQREAELLEQVRNTVNFLQGSKQRITQKSIAKVMGISNAKLAYYSGFREAYHQVMEERRRTRDQQARQREEALLQRIQDIVDQWETMKKPITLSGIAKEIGMTVAGLSKYPRIKTFFQTISKRRKTNSL